MKILIVGFGSIAGKHLAAINSIEPTAEVYALRSRPDSPKEEGVINIYSIDEAKSISADFAIVSNPTCEHLKTIEWLSELSLPLFIEKPIFDKLEKLPQIDALTYVACNLRFLDCLEWVKSHISGKRVNEVNVYCGSYLPYWRNKDIDWRTIYSANKEMGGGVHIDLIHEIDYLYWIFGKPNKVNKIFRNVSSLDISAYDYANYIFEYSTFTSSVVLNYYRRDYKRTMEIVFEDTTWVVDLADNMVMDISYGGVLFESEKNFGDTYLDQMKYFMQLLQSGSTESMNPAQTAIEVLKICMDDET